MIAHGGKLNGADSLMNIVPLSAGLNTATSNKLGSFGLSSNQRMTGWKVMEELAQKMMETNELPPDRQLVVCDT